MARGVINLQKAAKPRITEVQRNFCKELIGLGLARATIASLVLGKDTAALTPSDVSFFNGLITKIAKKELGFGISDARHAKSPFMAEAVKSTADKHRVRVRIA